MAKFLQVPFLVPSKTPRTAILQKPLRSLRKILEKTIAQDPRLTHLGHITFLTLVSPPHIFGENDRIIPKES